jgi:glucosylceramidase
MQLKSVVSTVAAGFLLASAGAAAESHSSVTVWLTKADRSSLLAKQATPLTFTSGNDAGPAIEVNDRGRFQSMDGFGFALTGGSAQLLMRMDAAQRTAFLQELVGTGEGDLGVSYLRVSIGSSDMNDHAFTYDDLPAGETDPTLAKFSLGPDSTTVVPVLKEILAIRPDIKILGSPWSAPAWMKTNDALKNGNLKPEDYPVYAQYFVKYLMEMQAQGIRVDAITVQNEPLNPHNLPSLVMQPQEEEAFIRDALGPALHKAHLRTKIILYDHNCDRPDYPLTILKDAKAAQFVDGSGFHLYEGEITALTTVHDAFPHKNLYFTEQMVVDRQHDPKLDIAEPEARLIVGAPRNWSRNVLLWNLAADPEFGPHTNDGGCPVCEGAVTLDGNTVTRNVAWYVVGHAAKFVPPGSVRIDSSAVEPLPNVAFRTPDGHHVLIVANTSHAAQSFQIRWHGKNAAATLDDGSVATYVW